jgi:23S rRNA-/tRNA-specific pseudouridylate synthase
VVELFRDQWLFVVDKAAGEPTQSTHKDERGLFEYLRTLYPYVGLHHRLDRAASGALLFSLDRGVNRSLAEAFRSHTICRKYRAVLYGEVEKEAQWEMPLAGKAASTSVRLLGSGRGLAAVQAELKTGRKHQIRQHAAMAGTPIVGDRRYGGEVARRWPRLALHACEISFEHPKTGKHICVTSSLPPSMQQLWEQVF